MTRGRFTAVIHGEFEIESGGRRVRFIALTAGAAALCSWLAAFLLELALTAGALAVAILAACWLLTRRNDRDTELLAERTAALHAEVTAASKPAAAEIHYHVHLPPGATAGGIGWALPPGDVS